jgi:hypothetical protein
MPQAVIWEAHRQHDEVALYVRTLIRASQAGARAALLTAVRQQADALDLTQAGLRAHRWLIPGPEPVPPPKPTRPRQSVRDRFRLEDGRIEVG